MTDTDPNAVAAAIASDAPPVTEPGEPLGEVVVQPSPSPSPTPSGESFSQTAPYGYKADGTPKKTTGRPSKKKPGQSPSPASSKKTPTVSGPSASKVVLPPGVTPPKSQEAPLLEKVEASGFDESKARALGPVIAGCFTGSMQGFLGEEFKPSQEETEALGKAWGDYLVASQTSDIPPWAGLALVTGAYLAPRLAKPTVQQRLVGYAWRVKRFFGLTKEQAPPC